MNKKSLVAVLALGAVLFSSSLTRNAHADASTSTDNSAWRARMQEMFASLQSLLAITVDESKFNDSSQSRLIREHAGKLAQSAAAMHEAARAKSRSKSSAPQIPDHDPSLAMFSEILKDQSAEALQAYSMGSRDYARTLFNSTASMCIACHSRTDSGVKLSWDVDSGPAASLPLQHKVQILAAGRAYDLALEKSYGVLADSKLARERPFEWNRALRTALVLSIRAEKDPIKAKVLLEKAMKTEGVPQFVKYDSRNWVRSLDAWAKEGTASSGGAVRKSGFETEDAAHREALRLITLAQKSQRYPMDHTGDVYYLRASSVLHDQLQKFPKGPKSAEAFFLLGICYEVLRDFDLWSLGDTYFEACIRRSPHTELSESCYRKLEESVLAGYTGSSGTQLPSDVERKLARLQSESSVPVQVAPGKKRN